MDACTFQKYGVALGTVSAVLIGVAVCGDFFVVDAMEQGAVPVPVLALNVV